MSNPELPLVEIGTDGIPLTGDPEYDQNFLIRWTAPIYDTPADYAAAMEKIPRRPENIHGLRTGLRVAQVNKVGNSYISRDFSGKLAERIWIMVREGFRSRNPQASDWMEKLRGISAPPGTATRVVRVRAIPRLIGAKGQTAVLIGPPSAGKSHAITAALGLVRQVVVHDDYTIVMYLRASMPAGGNVWGLVTNILEALDGLLGTNYLSAANSLRNRDAAVAYTAKILWTFHVGILVLEECDNFVENGDLMQFLVNVVDGCGIPIFFTGNDKTEVVFEKAWRTIRRMGGVENFTVALLNDAYRKGKVPEPDGEAEQFARKLLSCQVTPEVATFEEVGAALLYEGGYSPELIISKFVIGQMETLRLGRAKMSPEILEIVSKHRLGRYEGILASLREHDLTALKEIKGCREYVEGKKGALDKELERRALQAELERERAFNEQERQASAMQAMIRVIESVGGTREVGVEIATEIAAEDGDLTDLAIAGQEALKRWNERKNPTRRKRVGKSSAETQVDYEVLPQDDLRRVVHFGLREKKTVFESLGEAGLLSSTLIARLTQQAKAPLAAEEA